MSKRSSLSPSLPANASFGKRLLAILYDSLIVFFVIIITIIILQFIAISALGVDTVAIPNGENQAVGKEIPAESVVSYFFKSLWLILSLGYFTYFWTKQGQTPGMKVWKIKVIQNNGNHITWYQAVKRYLFAFFGLGLILVLFNKQNMALHDILSNTQLVSTQDADSKS